MNISTPRRMGALFLLLLGSARALPPLFGSLDTSDYTTAASSAGSEDYARNRLPDGTYATENYAFGKGGYYGSSSSDPTIDNESFMSIAQTIAQPLADH